MIFSRNLKEVCAFFSCVIIFMLSLSINIPVGYCEENVSHIDRGQRVLFLSSYSLSDTYATQQYEGIKLYLDKSIILKSEFLNSGIINDEKKYELFYDILKQHISSLDYPYDLVIVGDDEALFLVMNHKDELFPETPIVFEGIENENFAIESASDPWVTGSIELFDFEKNIDFALTLYPDAKNVIAIVDNTISGKGEKEQFYKAENKFPDLKFKDINTTYLTESEIISELLNLDNSDILLYLNMSESLDRKNYSEYEACKIISEYSPIPVFRLIDLGIGDGVLGGIVLSPHQSGISAAETATQILDGADISKMEIDTEPTTIHKFDSNVIKSFKLDINAFPGKATYVNYRASFKEKYGRSLAIGSIAIIIILVLFQILTKWIESRIQNRKLMKSATSLKEALMVSEKSEIAKSEYLNCISKEIRVPMNRLITLVDRTKSDINNHENIVDNINAIEMTTKSLFNSINEFLTISNLDADSLELKHEPFNLISVLSDLKQTYSKLCKERNISFTENRIDITENLYYGDSYKLNLLLSNILANALKYTENGKSIEMTTKQKVVDNEQSAVIEFVVSDAGIGMSRQKLKNIFNSSKTPNTDKEGGSGVGLAMTKRYVAMMNGEMSAKSAPNKGTTITVNIPLEICIDENKKTHIFKPVEEYDFKDKNVLIAEDNELNLAILNEVLKDVGFNTICVKNGREAVYATNKARYCDIDVILMDTSMPIMNGIDAANTIRKSKNSISDSIPIIAMSQNADSDEIERIFKSGMNINLNKPIDIDELYFTLENILYKTNESIDSVNAENPLSFESDS